MNPRHVVRCPSCRWVGARVRAGGPCPRCQTATVPARRYLVACSRAPHTPPPLPAPTTSVVRLRWIRAGIGRRPLLAAVVSLPSTWSQLEARYGELPASTPAPEPAALRAYGRDSLDLLSAMAVPFLGGGAR